MPQRFTHENLLGRYLRKRRNSGPFNPRQLVEIQRRSLRYRSYLVEIPSLSEVFSCRQGRFVVNIA